MPDSWIIKYLELIGINNKKTKSYWNTNIRLHAEGKLTETGDIATQRGIFHGDSLSLSRLLFWFSLILLTEKLDKLNTGYAEHTTQK